MDLERAVEVALQRLGTTGRGCEDKGEKGEEMSAHTANIRRNPDEVA
jgi:hypothetical protein